MVYLINEVIVDMISFFAILFYSTLTFAVIFMTLEVQKGSSESDMVGNIESSYLIGLGEFGKDGYNAA